MMLRILTGTAAGAALLALLVFIPRYHVVTAGAWRHHPWGRHVMIISVCMLLVLAQAVAFRIFGDWPGREWVLLAMFASYAGSLWQRVWLNERMGRASAGVRPMPEAQSSNSKKSSRSR